MHSRVVLVLYLTTSLDHCQHPIDKKIEACGKSFQIKGLADPFAAAGAFHGHGPSLTSSPNPRFPAAAPPGSLA